MLSKLELGVTVSVQVRLYLDLQFNYPLLGSVTRSSGNTVSVLSCLTVPLDTGKGSISAY